ncbi:MAG: hypothetical protein WA461_14620 [Nitrososphaeraceae archaeon]|jgi:hypothetical protein
MYELTLNPFGLRYDDGFEDGENSNPYDKDRANRYTDYSSS